MLQLLRLRELPMLLATARARGVGSSRSRRGRATCAHFVSIASNCCGNFCGSYRTYGSSFPLCLCLAKKTNTLRTRTHSHTYTLSQTHTHTRMESALNILFDCRKSWHFSDFSHVSVEKRKNNFQCLLISFRPSVASSCLFRSRPLPQLPLHMPACSHSVWQSPPLVPSPDRERFIECS